jgi:hypothetical protein
MEVLKYFTSFCSIFQVEDEKKTRMAGSTCSLYISHSRSCDSSRREGRRNEKVSAMDPTSLKVKFPTQKINICIQILVMNFMSNILGLWC